MYVCLCNGVTDHDIRHAVAAGCRTLSDLTVHTGCGTNCGCCLSMAEELLAEAAYPAAAAPSAAAMAARRQAPIMCVRAA